MAFVSVREATFHPSQLAGVLHMTHGSLIRKKTIKLQHTDHLTFTFIYDDGQFE